MPYNLLLLFITAFHVCTTGNCVIFFNIHTVLDVYVCVCLYNAKELNSSIIEIDLVLSAYHPTITLPMMKRKMGKKKVKFVNGENEKKSEEKSLP